MTKVMVFIDGSWLYHNQRQLADRYGGGNYRLDYGKLPDVLVEVIEKEMEVTGTGLVRTYLFGSYPSNYDEQDEPLVQRQLEFLSMLTEEFHFEVVKFPINFFGRRVRRQDRKADDAFELQEKYVDVALATTMT